MKKCIVNLSPYFHAFQIEGAVALTSTKPIQHTDAPRRPSARPAAIQSNNLRHPRDYNKFAHERAPASIVCMRAGALYFSCTRSGRVFASHQKPLQLERARFVFGERAIAAIAHTLVHFSLKHCIEMRACVRIGGKSARRNYCEIAENTSACLTHMRSPGWLIA